MPPHSSPSLPPLPAPVVGGAIVVTLCLAATAVLGALAGAGVRVLLGRLRRPTVVGRGSCEVGLAAAWLPVTGAVVTGAATPGWAPLWAVVGVLAVAGSATDLVDRRLPDAVTAAGLVGVLAATVPLGAAAVGRAVLGAAVLLAAHATVALVAPGALGGGDVKLAPALGAALAGADGWALPAGPVVAALGVLVLAVVRRRRAVPFGPPALASTWALVGLVAITLGRSP